MNRNPAILSRHPPFGGAVTEDESMMRFITRFWTEEDGNTTIDWMVLTAGLVLLGAAVMAAVGTPANDLADRTTTVIDGIETGA